MKLHELLTELGDDGYAMQVLGQCMLGADMRKHHTEIRFANSDVTVNDLLENKKVAFIVWVDKDKLDETLEAAKK